MPRMASSTVLPMVGCLALAFKCGQASFLRNPEDVDRPVLVGIFRVGPRGAFSVQFGVLLLEGIGDVFQEDQADHVLVLGRVHVGASHSRRPSTVRSRSQDLLHSCCLRPSVPAHVPHGFRNREPPNALAGIRHSPSIPATPATLPAAQELALNP